jgi:Carbohydrate binding domain
MKNHIITLCISMFIMVNCAKAQKNLVTDGGFEEDDLYGWNNGGAAKQTPWDFKTGKNSCVIITTNADNWTGIDQTIRIPKKVQAVEFSAWIKARHVVKGKNDWDGAIFTIVFLDPQDKQLGDGVNIAKVTGDQEWTLFTKIIRMPEKASSFKILVAMGNASGTMLIDDVTAKTLSPEEVAKL